MRTLIIATFLFLTYYSHSQEQYEYLTMTQQHNEIIISSNNQDVSVVDIKDEKSKNALDFGPLLRRIVENEQQGWELYSNQVYVFSSGEARNYVLMRKKK